MSRCQLSKELPSHSSCFLQGGWDASVHSVIVSICQYTHFVTQARTHWANFSNVSKMTTYPHDKLNEQLCDGEEVNCWTRHFPEQLWVSLFPNVDRQHVTQTNSFFGDPVLTLTNSQLKQRLQPWTQQDVSGCVYLKSRYLWWHGRCWGRGF